MDAGGAGDIFKIGWTTQQNHVERCRGYHCCARGGCKLPLQQESSRFSARKSCRAAVWQTMIMKHLENAPSHLQLETVLGIIDMVYNALERRIRNEGK